jgi:hypothetical protein
LFPLRQPARRYGGYWRAAVITNEEPGHLDRAPFTLDAGGPVDSSFAGHPVTYRTQGSQGFEDRDHVSFRRVL